MHSSATSDSVRNAGKQFRPVSRQSNLLRHDDASAPSFSECVSLPVRRRGCFKSLKRTAGSLLVSGRRVHKRSSKVSSKATHVPLSERDWMEYLASERKQTHWEKYGTVMVLYVCESPDPPGSAIPQRLAAEGYDVGFSTSLESGTSSCKDVLPDIIVLMNVEPSMVPERLQDLETWYPNTPALFLVPPQCPQAATVASSTSVECIFKPVNAEDFISRVEKHLRSKHLQSQEGRGQSACHTMPPMVSASFMSNLGRLTISGTATRNPVRSQPSRLRCSLLQSCS